MRDLWRRLGLIWPVTKRSEHLDLNPLVKDLFDTLTPVAEHFSTKTYEQLLEDSDLIALLANVALVKVGNRIWSDHPARPWLFLAGTREASALYSRDLYWSVRIDRE